jgi:hypothetical protein
MTPALAVARTPDTPVPDERQVDDPLQMKTCADVLMRALNPSSALNTCQAAGASKQHRVCHTRRLSCPCHTTGTAAHATGRVAKWPAVAQPQLWERPDEQMSSLPGCAP